MSAAIIARRLLRCRSLSSTSTPFAFGGSGGSSNVFRRPSTEEDSEPTPNDYSQSAPPKYQPASYNSSNKEPSHLVFPDEASQQFDLAAFPGAGTDPFAPEIVKVLNEPVRTDDIEIKPDGNAYLPESKYRKTLDRAFGVGGWALIPRSPHSIQGTVLSREYALLCHGRFVSQARGHATVMSGSASFLSSSAAASESLRSNALMRCCKDLGIARELWDGNFVAAWRNAFAQRRLDPSGRRHIWSKKSPSEPSTTASSSQ